MPLPVELKKQYDHTLTSPWHHSKRASPIDHTLQYSIGRRYWDYLELLRDGHIRGTLGKRRNSILSRAVRIKSTLATKKASAAIEKTQSILRACNYERLCTALLNTGQLIGFSVVQLNWRSNGTIVYPVYQHLPQNRFTFILHDPDNKTVPVATGEKVDPANDIVLSGNYELRLLTNRNPSEGERCPKNRFLLYTFEAEESPWGIGLGYTLQPLYQIKTQAFNAMFSTSKRAGDAPALGTTPEGYSLDDPNQALIIQQFEQFLESIAPSGWGRFPNGFAIESALGDISPDFFEKIVTIADNQISKVTLGEVPYSDSNFGSYAAAESQVEDRESGLIDADCNLLDEQLAGLWKLIQEFNFRDVPIFVFRETRADDREVVNSQKEIAIKMESARYDAFLIKELGLTPTAEYINDRYGSQWSLKQEESLLSGFGA